MDYKIVGISAIRNPLSQGYPFLESIYSFLNWGDKLYILDGFSNDGTQNILERLSKNKKIKIIKKEWDYSKKYIKAGQTIGKAFDSALDVVKLKEGPKNYVFELQSNEIAHEQSHEELRQIPEYWPKFELYSLPYLRFSGPYFFTSAFFMRLAKLNKNLRVLGDGTSFALTKDITLRKFIKNEARRFYWYKQFEKSYAFMLQRDIFRMMDMVLVPIHNPIFRYNWIFPKTIKEKFKSHSKVYGFDMYKNMYERIKKLEKKDLSVNEFYYNLQKEFADEIGNKGGGNADHYSIKYVDINKHPKIMRDLLNRKEYFVRENIIQEIQKL